MRAEIEGGPTLEFPDGTDPSVVQATVKKVLAGQIKQPKEEKEPPTSDPLVERAKQVPGEMREAVGAVAEPVAQLATSAFAKPASDVAGLTSLGMEGLRRAGVPGIEERDPQTVKEDVQRALTYEPRTKAGQAVAQYNPLALLGKGVDWAGRQLEQVVAPPETSGPLRAAAGYGVKELVGQAPSFAGAKSPGVFAAAKKSTENVAKELMQSAMKPTWLASERKAAVARTAAETMLKEGLNVTPKGLEALHARITAFNNRIAQLIDNSPAVIDKEKVANRIFPLIEKFYKQVNATDDVIAAQKAWEDFVGNPLIKDSKTIPIKLAQEMKQGTYQALKGKYGEMGSASTEAQKWLARGLKEEIAKEIPELRPLNAQEQKLMKAMSMVERRVLQSAGKKPIGLGLVIRNPLNFAAFMADRSELFKSLVSRMIYRSAQAIPTGAYLPAAGIAVTGQASQQQVPDQVQPRPQ